MKKAKQIVTILAVLLVAASLVACGDSAEETDQVITRDTSVDETTTEESTQSEDEQSENSEADDAQSEDSDTGDEQLEDSETEDTTTAAAADTQTSSADAYSFVAEGVTLTPGEAFDSSCLSEASDVYTVESCAIEGMDNVYMYDAFELTAFDDGSGEVIYSIYLTDANITTPEGLALGDDLSLSLELYGEDYEGDDTGMTYTKGDTQLIILFDNEVVSSIEYVLILSE